MPSERIQRQIDSLLDEAEAAVKSHNWAVARERCESVLAIDPQNDDARVYLAAAHRVSASPPPGPIGDDEPLAAPRSQPASFVGGRYQVRRFLGEGGKKRVYLAHDTVLDRDVAFAVIKTEGLDDVGRQRVTREAQAMGRMGAHPHIVSVFDLGDEGGAPYIVSELMEGGDVEGELERAGGPLELSRALEIAKSVARGLAYAHERGIVHRDLKPGNVWLTAEGVAKIGDFGLAVAEGRSRLTQHGMMVGTFGYMPPEQALGGEVTAQSDLYSFGAMLYELVTGKPPFEADDPTAVISQHLNAEPVAPSWRTERCPPALEGLILALLAKDSNTRPASAVEVLSILEGIDPDAPSRSHSSDSTNPLERLARGVFVGRGRELERLRGALDEAFAGHGSVVMLVGEPGIGKTRTVAELETHARMRGAKVLWGRAHESSGAPPYWPWVQVGRAWGRQNDVQALIRGRLGERQIEELSRLFPELPALLGLPMPDLNTVADEGAQFRLFDTYVDFLHITESDGPVVVVLDDLHWADEPTLQLLKHVVRELPNMRVLLIGTYRDTELARTHPLSDTLAELNRDSGFLRISLGGLARGDVATYVEATARIDPAPALVDRIYAETEGNPFFLSQVVNLMAEEGTLAAHSVSDISIPEGVREALGRRLDRLSGDANGLLSYAAVAGRQFSYDTIALLSGHDNDILLRLIEEGLAARVIEETEQAGRYRFTHALMQETLLAELSTTRRVRMHGEVGEALEQRLGEHASDRAAELAAHFTESAALNAEHAEKAVHYSVLAGRQAEQRFAWAETVRHLSTAVNIIDEKATARDVDLAALLTSLGAAEAYAGGWRDGWRHLARAMDLSRERKDGVAFAAAVLGTRGMLIPSSRLESITDECVELLGDTEPSTQLEILLRSIGATDFNPRFLVRARAIARAHSLRKFEPGIKLAEAMLVWRGLVASEDGIKHVKPQVESALALQREALAEFLAAGDRHGALRAWEVTLYSALSLGRLREAEELARNYWREAAALHAGYNNATAASKLAIVLLLHADFAGAEQILSNFPVADYVGKEVALLEMAVTQGDGDACSELIPDGDRSGGVAALALWVHGRRALAFSVLGDAERAAAAMSEWVSWWERIENEFAHHGYIADSVGSLVAFCDDAMVRRAYDVLTLDPSIRCTVIGSFTVDVARGILALRLGLLDEAEQHFRTGLAWCEKEDCPIEAGRNHQGLADLAELRGDHALTMQHLDAAGELFSRHGAKLYLDQVLAKKQILKA